MKNTLLLISLVVAIAAAEKYAIIVGGAKGWGNYPVFGVLFGQYYSPLVYLPQLC